LAKPLVFPYIFEVIDIISNLRMVKYLFEIMDV